MRMTTIKILITDVEQPELSDVTGGDATWSGHNGNQLGSVA